MSDFEREGFGYLQESAKDATLSSLDLFSPDPVETKIKERICCSLRPVTSIDAGGPYRFRVPGERNSYIDGTSFRINTKFCIKRINPANRQLENIPAAAGAAALVYPVDMMSSFLWKNVETKLNHTEISNNSSNTYGIKAALTTYLSYPESAQNSLLRASFAKKDTTGAKENIAANVNAQARAAWISESKTVETSDPIYTELTSTDKFITPGVEIEFLFTEENINKLLIVVQQFVGAGEDAVAQALHNYKLVFSELVLTYDRIILKDLMSAAYSELLLKTPAIYPYTVTDIRTKTFDDGQQTARWDNCYAGKIPDQILICMNKTQAADGVATRDILNFERFNIEQMILTVNSKAIPSEHLKFGEDDCIRAYRWFCDNSGVGTSTAPTMITYEDFKNGMFIVPYDLSGDRCALYHTHEKKIGNISLEVNFREDLEQKINIYFVSVYRSNFYISGPEGNRKVEREFPKRIADRSGVEKKVAA